MADSRRNNYSGRTAHEARKHQTTQTSSPQAKTSASSSGVPSAANAAKRVWNGVSAIDSSIGGGVSALADTAKSTALGYDRAQYSDYTKKLMNEAAQYRANALQGLTPRQHAFGDALINFGQAVPAIAVGAASGGGVIPAMLTGAVTTAIPGAGAAAYNATENGANIRRAASAAILNGGIDLAANAVPAGRLARARVDRFAPALGAEVGAEIGSEMMQRLAEIAVRNKR